MISARHKQVLADLAQAEEELHDILRDKESVADRIIRKMLPMDTVRTRGAKRGDDF